MKANPAKAVQAANARIQSQHAPAHVIADADAAGDALRYAPRVERYLELRAGAPTRNVVAMARRGLKSELRLALRRAVALGRGVTQEHVKVETAGGPVTITLTVEPLPVQDGPGAFLIVFADQPSMSAHLDASDHAPGSHPRDDLVEQHEREQHDLREQLQSTSEEYDTAVEELKSANEELHSTNEEPQSFNEELETSKEEIQSVNEELHTVSGQLVKKVDDLDKANSDLKNLFESTKVATVFLDRHLIIRNFTPAIASVYNLLMEGPPVPLRSTGALALGMILHELATNAVKCGALSTPKGMVKVRWNFEPSAAGEQLMLRWTETGGPAVTPPTRRGFGGRLIDRGIKHELGGTSAVRFDEAGMEAILTIPLSPATIGRTVAKREPAVT